MRLFCLPTVLSLIAFPVFAEDAAVLIGADRYVTLDRFSGGTDVTDAAEDLRGAGYVVDALMEPSVDAMRNVLTRLQSRAENAERLIVVLAGQFVTDGTRSWFLSVNAPAPTLFELEQEAVSIESVLHVLASAPGQAILMLASDPRATGSIGPTLREGIGVMDIPQGVTVIQGDPRSLSRLIEGAIITPQADVLSAVVNANGLEIDGFQPKTLVMQATAPSRATASPRPVIVDQQAEREKWAQAQQVGTLEAYQTYLRQYPNGVFASDVTDAIEKIVSEPNRAARLAEESLSLTRDARRSIQRDLSILKYNTRGIDGIYGQGTRTAISNWQQENGFAQTTYLTSEQITRINAQAARRSAQLEEEAARARAQELQLDRAYWEETGAKGERAGFRSYLERYPDGSYADQATSALKLMEENTLAQAARADRDAWTEARNLDNAEAYQAYLKDFRDGAFRDEAQTRVTALRDKQANAASSEQARGVEASLNLNPLTRGVIEQRLSQLGLDPGAKDGQFDNVTRRAIRQFQRSRNLDPTGFLTQSALVQLLLPNGN